MLAYDENGNLREFEEFENIVVCSHCKNSTGSIQKNRFRDSVTLMMIFVRIVMKVMDEVAM